MDETEGSLPDIQPRRGAAMGERTVVRFCGVCQLLAGVLGLAAAPIAMSIGYPMLVDFGDSSVLTQFAAAAPWPFLFALLQISLPTLTLSATPGFYWMLRDRGPGVVLGVALMMAGLVFTTIQDGVEVTLVHYLPAAYASATEAARPALLAIGDFGGTAMDVFGRLGSVAFAGLLLINLAMWTCGGRRRLVAALGIIAGTVILIAAFVPPLFNGLAFLAIGFPVGFIALRI